MTLSENLSAGSVPINDMLYLMIGFYHHVGSYVGRHISLLPLLYSLIVGPLTYEMIYNALEGLNFSFTTPRASTMLKDETEFEL